MLGVALLKYFQPIDKKLDLPDPDGSLSSTVASQVATCSVIFLVTKYCIARVHKALDITEENKKPTCVPYLSLTRHFAHLESILLILE